MRGAVCGMRGATARLRTVLLQSITRPSPLTMLSQQSIPHQTLEYERNVLWMFAGNLLHASVRDATLHPRCCHRLHCRFVELGKSIAETLVQLGFYLWRHQAHHWQYQSDPIGLYGLFHLRRAPVLRAPACTDLIHA